MPSTLVISEVHPAGSGNGTYAADWFEVTNTGATAVDITGWKMDDNSNAFANAVALRRRDEHPRRASRSSSSRTTPSASPTSTIIATSRPPGLGRRRRPRGFLIGAYGGSGVGLSTGGDAVNLFDASGNRITGVSFGAATATATFDNTAGLGSTTLPLPRSRP